MKTQLELFNVARDTAQTIIGETNLRKINSAIETAFAGTGCDDDDYGSFAQYVTSSKAQIEGLQARPTATEVKAKQKATAAAKPA